jgi:hypothetical protein
MNDLVAAILPNLACCKVWAGELAVEPPEPYPACPYLLACLDGWMDGVKIAASSSTTLMMTSLDAFVRAIGRRLIKAG